MEEIDKGYKFECSGREINTFSVNGFSLQDDTVSVGCDSSVKIIGEDWLEPAQFTSDEKKELAKFVIQQWAEWADLIIGIHKPNTEN